MYISVKNCLHKCTYVSVLTLQHLELCLTYVSKEVEVGYFYTLVYLLKIHQSSTDKLDKALLLYVQSSLFYLNLKVIKNK